MPVSQWLLLAAILTILGGLLGAGIYADRLSIELREKDRLIAQAKVVAENLGSQLLTTNRALNSLRSDFSYLMQQRDGENLVKRRLHGMGDAMLGVRTLVIIDARGRGIASNREELVGLNFRDGERFQAVRQGGDANVLYVSPPFRTVLGTYSIGVGKMMQDDRGAFSGVVMAILDPEYFGTLLSSVRYAPGMLSSLIHGDGKIVYRVPDTQGLAGLNLQAKPGAFFVQHMKSGQATSVFAGVVASSGESRLTILHTIRPANIPMNKPLVVAVSREMSALYATWRQEALVKAGLLAALFLTAALVLYFYQRRQQAFQRLLANQEREAALRRHQDELKSAQRVASIGNWNWDLASNAHVWSEEIFAIYGRDPALPPAIYPEVQKYFTPDSWTLIVADLEKCLSAGGSYERDAEVVRPDGTHRWVSIFGNAVRDERGEIVALHGTVQDISERKQTEMRLAELNRDFVAFLENTSDFIYFKDRNSRFRFCSQTLANITGHASWRDLIGKHDLEVFPHDTAQIYYEEELPVFQEGKPLLNRVDPYYDATGKQGWVSTNKWPLVDAAGKVVGLFGISRDVTEVMRTQAQLKQSLDEQQAILQSEVVGIALVRKRVVVWVNSAMARMHGYDVAALTNQPTRIFYASDEAYAEFAAAAYPVLEAGGVFRSQFQYRSKNGSLGWFDVSGARLAGATEESIWAFVDISSQKRNEADLLEARLTADRANLAKSRFLAMMSHEIRTPMNAILGMAQMLVTPNLDEAERLGYARIVLSSGQSLLTLLNDILDFSKIEAGKIKLEHCVFDPVKIIEETRSLFAVSAAAKRLAIEAAWVGPCGQAYLGDPYRLRQMLSNLVGNAIKFTAQGKVSIEVGELQRDEQTAILEFAVADTGIGIDQEKLPMLFQTFSQADSSTTRQYGGSGLGLSIVRSLAQLMDGDVGVASEFGKGARFWFRIRVPLVEGGANSRQGIRQDSNFAPVGVAHSKLSQPAAEAGPPNMDSIVALWRELEPMLAHNEFGAVRQFNLLQDALAGTGLAAELAEIGQALTALHFDTVLERMRNIAAAQSWEEKTS